MGMEGPGSQETPEEVAKNLDKKRSLLDKILGKNKSNPTEIAHEQALLEDKLREHQAMIDAAHIDALYEDWRRKFEARCVLNYSSDYDVHPDIFSKEVISGTIDGKSFKIKKIVLYDGMYPPNIENQLIKKPGYLPETYSGELVGIAFSKEQAMAIWDKVLPLALDQTIKDHKQLSSGLEKQSPESEIKLRENKNLIDGLAQLG